MGKIPSPGPYVLAASRAAGPARAREGRGRGISVPVWL